MALDQGTTSSRCILFDKQGNIASMAQKEFTQIYPKPGYVEHDPMEIWSSQLSVATEAMAKVGISVDEVEAIGITNQRETTICWDKNTGHPIYNAIVWQCRRTSEMIDELKRKGYEEYITETTGLVPDAYFSGSKIAWILENVEGARDKAVAGDLLFGTVDTWLIWNLTKGKKHVTDYTNASRTMLFDIHKLCWDKKLLQTLNIPESMLPTVLPSSSDFGYTHEPLLGKSLPIYGVAGDQQAALFGQCCFTEGEAKNTYGIGCFLLMNTGSKAIRSKHGLLTTIAASTSTREVQYALEGSVFVAGASVQWLRDELHMVSTAQETEELATKVKDTNGMYIVPAFTGLGAPYWNQYARGTIVGLSRGCNREHFVRATLESIAYQAVDVMKAMEEDALVELKNLKVDGGASQNAFLMQFQADLLGTSVCKPKCIETTALGAAYLAGLKSGFWENREEIRANWQMDRVFETMMDEKEREERLLGWKKAMNTTLFWGKIS